MYPAPARGERIASLEGYRVLGESEDIYHEGELVAKFCKNELCAGIVGLLSRALGRAPASNCRRGDSAGQILDVAGKVYYCNKGTFLPVKPGMLIHAPKRKRDGQPSPYNVYNTVKSTIVGYTSVSSRGNSGIKGAASSESRPYAWTRDHPREWAAAQPVFRALSNSMKARMPEQHSAQMKRQTHARIEGTPWTTAAVNLNFATGCHLDGQDAEGAFTALTTAGDWRGGEFALPQLRVAVDVRPGDVLFARTDAWWHGNAPITGGDRLAVVAYLHKTLLVW